ncbi:type II secretion system protein GspE [Agromyces sp. MMS17-SY077]|uniref:Type II secretion system protein GspE n=1 Tax=Agromyces seonyuensis TaxID=2662446 RepID=A0A6I4P756_9MICO|nr:ATPase, T2SS/T4P/T4SS family [Agromyces seonyuensis]MWB99584.1 type II secretion system protein GspE [Agromyces seonyuensis]
MRRRRVHRRSTVAALGEILIRNGDLPAEHLDAVLAADDGDDAAFQRFVEDGVLTEEQLARARALQAGVRYIDDLLVHPIDQSAIDLVSPGTARRHGLLPLGFVDGRMLVAMTKPGDVVAIDDVRVESGFEVTPVTAKRADVLAVVERHHRADHELSDLTSTLDDELAAATSADAYAVTEVEDDAPIVRFVNLLVAQAIADQASDIHIEPQEREVRVRYRIDGVLHEMQSAPKSIQAGIVSRLKIMSDIDIAERRRPQDGRMSAQVGGRKVDLRVATLPTVWGEKIVLRILDNSATSLDLRDLGLSESNRAVYERSFRKPHGMLLVTGPTGSGKSTTLYSTLLAIARPEVNVITVEDPVEYRIEGISQMQVNTKAGLTFASALRSILRADPDIVLVGEIRDRETAQIAIEASLTGHLVLSTLHTNDAPSAVTRLVEMGVEPFLVGTALECVVAQRLARRLCSRCKTTVESDRAELGELGVPLPPYGTPRLYGPVGCQACAGTGYRGRVALHEVMSVTEDIERLAVAHAPSSEIAASARGAGMRALREDGWSKALAGVTSIEEVLRVAS